MVNKRLAKATNQDQEKYVMGAEFKFIRFLSTCVVVLNLVIAYYAISNIVQTRLTPHFHTAQTSISTIEQFHPQMMAALEGNQKWATQ